MCGRYALFSLPDKLAARFGAATIAPGLGSVRPRYNIAPSQPILIVRADPHGLPELSLAKWGFVPRVQAGSRPAHEGVRPAPINARIESVASSPMFRDAFRHRRCLVPADAFYEWKRADATGSARAAAKQPMAVRARDGFPLAMAGVWDPSDAGPTAAILTTAANSRMATIHARMPVILPESVWAEWLDPSNTDANRVRGMIRATPDDALEIVAVSRRVNSPTHDDADCLAPDDGRDQVEPESLFT